MRNFIVVVFLLGLCLSSCKKENIELSDEESESISKVEMIEIQGVMYSRDSIFNEISKVSGFEVSDIYFDSNNQMFRIKSFELSEFKPDDYLILNK